LATAELITDNSVLHPYFFVPSGLGGYPKINQMRRFFNQTRRPERSEGLALGGILTKNAPSKKHQSKAQVFQSDAQDFTLVFSVIFVLLRKNQKNLRF
jgi:hypothetical protein